MAYYPNNYFNPYYNPQQSSGIVWIGSEKEAALYPVAPNGAITLWNQNEPVVYLKQADASGRPTLRAYDLVERPQSNGNAESGKDIYATKEELKTLSDAIMKELEKMKGEKDEQPVF